MEKRRRRREDGEWTFAQMRKGPELLPGLQTTTLLLVTVQDCCRVQLAPHGSIDHNTTHWSKSRTAAGVN
jgi:hypothetical protein